MIAEQVRLHAANTIINLVENAKAVIPMSLADCVPFGIITEEGATEKLHQSLLQNAGIKKDLASFLTYFTSKQLEGYDRKPLTQQTTLREFFVHWEAVSEDIKNGLLDEYLTPTTFTLNQN